MKKHPASSTFFRRAALGAAASLALAVVVQAQDTYPSTPSNTPVAPKANEGSYSSLTRADTRFVVKAGKTNSEELAIARVAVTRATSPDVRAFATEVVAAHDAIANGIARLAAAKTISLDPVAADQVSRQWNDKKAADFDRDFLKETTTAHKGALDLYEEAARDGRDSDIATFAREQVTGLKDRLNKAEQLRKIFD
jgi:putative membrane protein